MRQVIVCDLHPALARCTNLTANIARARDVPLEAHSSPFCYSYVYSQLGAFMIPGCPTGDPLCLNTAQVAVGRYGNGAVNSLHGDPLAVTHLSVGKSFPIRERMALRYTLLISNLFNHPHYYNPDGYITDLFNSPSGGPCVGVLNNFPVTPPKVSLRATMRGSAPWR